jgi:hypothetical protein
MSMAWLTVEDAPMNMQEKTLYHQIHPLKLFTDWGTGLVALYFLWQHNIVVGLIVAFVPSIVVTLLLVRIVNLERYKQSSFGQYIRKYMTRLMELIRFVGYAMMAIGAWYHIAWLIPLGLAVILLAWLRGVIFPGWTV